MSMFSVITRTSRGLRSLLAPCVGVGVGLLLGSTSLAWSADAPTDTEAALAEAKAKEPAQPGLGVPALRVSGLAYTEVAPGGTVIITFVALPKAPVHVVSLGLGAFANGKTEVQVVADAEGKAAVPWTATPGTVSYVTITAISPVTAGRATVTVKVL